MGCLWVRKGLDRATVLSLVGAKDSPAGMRKYEAHLKLSEAKDPGQRDELMKKYCRGWFIGSKKEKRELAKELALGSPSIDWALTDYAELNQARWEAIVASELEKRKISEEALRADPKRGAKGVKRRN